MAKAVAHFACQDCGASYRKWSGHCESCGGWNTITQETPTESAPRGVGPGKGRPLEFVELRGHDTIKERIVTGIAELDRVAGGGLVSGSAILVGGDPGIGKSTLLLQVVCALAGRGTVYISGEEAAEQVRMRANRLGLTGDGVRLGTATNVRDVLTIFEEPAPPTAIVIDSIQTMYVDTIDSAPGTVSQVRASAQELIKAAKRRGVILFLVGHVTKDGQIAGPRVLEHMVDTVLYFEGERSHHFRILRAVKNRFGPTDEIGVFEMSDRGLMEVANPSSLFLSSRDEAISGAAVFAGIEGTRPVLVEIEALVAPSSLGTPRRAVVGWDSARLAMVLAVLEARCGLNLVGRDVYLNVAGGLRVNEPAADLAVAAALVSSMSQIPLPPGSVVFGEIGLSGEIRGVNQAGGRLKEAKKLGFSSAIVPHGSGLGSKMNLREVKRLVEVVDMFELDDGAAAANA
ncbi:MAG: DNA repair protein RadA [Alphaproteobacteria bacterium]|nr:DNA repair protein RadA [Alphaproteobacteria bacterium]